MSRISFYFSLLKYSILHPKGGIQIIQAKQQTKEDASQTTYAYKADQRNLDDILHALFPEEKFSFDVLKQEVKPLQNKLKRFFASLESEKYPSKAKPYPIDYSLTEYSGVFLYLLCRIAKPEIVVETGIAYGNSSSYILQALKENKKGKLYSIDSVFRPWETKEMIGSAIPADLRDMWHFVFGVTTEKLSKLLKDLGSADIFFHDSLHTFKNMMFEFETAWPFIKKDGFLVSDDIIENNAFYKFYSFLNLEPVIITHGNKRSLFGILKKI